MRTMRKMLGAILLVQGIGAAQAVNYEYQFTCEDAAAGAVRLP
jgi:hypothetical protein